MLKRAEVLEEGVHLLLLVTRLLRDRRSLDLIVAVGGFLAVASDCYDWLVSYMLFNRSDADFHARRIFFNR